MVRGRIIVLVLDIKPIYEYAFKLLHNKVHMYMNGYGCHTVIIWMKKGGFTASKMSVCLGRLPVVNLFTRWPKFILNDLFKLILFTTVYEWDWGTDCTYTNSPSHIYKVYIQQ